MLLSHERHSETRAGFWAVLPDSSVAANTIGDELAEAHSMRLHAYGKYGQALREPYPICNLQEDANGPRFYDYVMQL